MDKARHAFGMLENIDSALSSGTIDSYDILFVKNADGKPFVGWIDRDGNKVVCDNSAELAALEAEIATKVDAEEVETAIATKADATEVENIKAEIGNKVDAATVKTMIEEYSESVIEVVEF